MIDIVTSAKNPVVKHLRKLLSNAKYRRQEKLAVAEGAHLVSSLLQAGLSVKTVVYAEGGLQNAEIDQLKEQLNDANSLVLKDELFESIANIHASIGVLAVFEPPRMTPPGPLTSDCLLLEDIQDPGNLGTILRTAAAAGVRSIHLSANCASAWSPKVLRAGMGAQFSLAIHEEADLPALVKTSELQILATDLTGDTTLYQADLRQPTAWLFGNEGQGVSPELLQACSQRITIPQAASTVESLNVSAAAAVCLFEQYRQRL